MENSIERHGSFASLYDFGTLGDWLYRPGRRRAINQLHINSDDVVFDFFCGTGVNFPLLLNEISPDGKIVAVDGSQEMLDEAKREARKTKNKQIELLLTDFTTAQGIQKVVEAIHGSGARKFLFTLGLTCLPNWREFFDSVFEVAPPGARFSIMDVYNERLSLGARLMNWVAYS